MYRPYNPNPAGNRTDDCTIRAICKATGKSWDEVYTGACLQGFLIKCMPESNVTWHAYLKKLGYSRSVIPNSCPDCYTVAEFAADHPKGTYILALRSHVVTVIDGDYYDIWDSGAEVPIYYWCKEEGQPNV